ncbi:O-antigen ligase family protein [Pelagibacterales bacterium SAG-MED18]|nr:O-antigen ligase family protein [Pelagibacterales bacterium SAG-MED18]
MTFESSKEKFIFYNFPVILFSLIPFFLITGPLLSDLSVSLISLLFLIYCIYKKNFSYFKNKYFYFFLVFWIYLVINSLLINFNLDSLKISFFYFRYGIFVVAIFNFFILDDKFIKYFFYCIFFCFLALVLDGFYEYFMGKNVLGWESSSSRTSSFFGEEKILGSYLSRLWPIFFGLSTIIFTKKNKLFFILILIFILSEVLIFLSGDRTAFLYINLSSIFIIMFSYKLFKLRLMTLLTSVFLILIISYVNPTAKERVFDKTLEQMNLNNNSGEETIYIFTKTHTYQYITAYKMYLDNKLLGVGVKNFRKFCNDKKYNYKNSKLSCNIHPHNYYIQILTETGIIGFIFLIIIVFYFFKLLFKHILLKFKNKYYFNDFEICILAGILIYIWPITPTGNVFNNWLNIIMIVNLPFLIWSRNSNKVHNK